jgi:hypothetical protein
LVVFGYRDIINVFFQGFEGGFWSNHYEAPQKLKGLAKLHLLIKDHDIEVERFKGENNGNKDVSLLENSTKLKHLYLHALIDHVRSFFLHLFIIVLNQWH